MGKDGSETRAETLKIEILKAPEMAGIWQTRRISEGK
jgi:hypothetical protein